MSGLKNSHLVLLVLLGTFVRALYLVFAKTWLETPDQLAWQLVLDQMQADHEFSYQQLMYYPHEGGGFLIALIALCFKPLGLFPSLSWAASLIDSLARFIQIKLSEKLFGTRTAFYFALWSVMATPLLIRWAGVNFCLHHFSSVLPFVFLYVVIRYPSRPWLYGLVAGLSLGFSYINFILVPAYIVYTLLSQDKTSTKKIYRILQFIGFVIIGILPHLLLRIFPDNGFHLENMGVAAVREFTLSDTFSFIKLKNLFAVFVKPLPASFFLAVGGKTFSIIERVIVLIFFAGGGYFIWKNKDLKDQKHLLAYLLIGIFILLYAFSPFYANEGSSSSYYYYRHLTYIMPLLVLLLISIYTESGKKASYYVPVWIFVCICFSSVYMFSTMPSTKRFYKVEGWILARKFGDDPARLMKLYKMAPEPEKAELNFGFGWGIAASLLNKKTGDDTMSVQRMKEIYQAFPKENRKLVYEGIQYAFEPRITPVLEPKLRLLFNKSIEENNE